MRENAKEGAGLDELERVYREQAPALRRVAAAIIGDRESALDAVQQAFAIAVRRRASFQRLGPLEGWVWRIVVNEARRWQPNAETLAADRASDVRRPQNGHADHMHAVRVAVALLPERQRLMVFLRHYADLDYRTIAEVLDVREGTVAAALSSAHARLREMLEEVHQ